jgi:hypothetical protein
MEYERPSHFVYKNPFLRDNQIYALNSLISFIVEFKHVKYQLNNACLMFYLDFPFFLNYALKIKNKAKSKTYHIHISIVISYIHLF